MVADKARLDNFDSTRMLYRCPRLDAPTSTTARRVTSCSGTLASGGMAELYFARVVGLAGFERHVVLKRIVAHHARDPEFVAMFLDEARLAAQLHHPNIAQVFDIGRMVDSYFFTMEYIHGESARALFRRCVAQQRTMPLHLVLTVVAGAAAGLHYAHEKRSPDEVPLAIVHRDVSPSNVMIGFDGAVKVVDFGIARAVTRSVETRSGVVRGKLGYMAPEQCGASLRPPVRRVRVGHHAVRAGDDDAAVRGRERAHGIIEASRARHRAPARGARVPAALDAIVAAQLARCREDRYPTAAERSSIWSSSPRRSGAPSPLALGAFMRDVFGARPNRGPSCARRPTRPARASGWRQRQRRRLRPTAPGGRGRVRSRLVGRGRRLRHRRGAPDASRPTRRRRRCIARARSPPRRRVDGAGAGGWRRWRLASCSPSRRAT
ncbi:MAG: serine/threonine protein kinase [Myxococcales bacterium]|nr:serine/threonine protein kinase [Myxococcales bacterium]